MKRWIALLLTGLLGIASAGCAASGTGDMTTAATGDQAVETSQAGTKDQEDTNLQAEATSNNDSEALDEEITGEIEIACYDSIVYKNFLEEAAKGFEALYPNASVTVNAFSAMPDVKTTTTADGKTMSIMTAQRDEKEESDYINRINTELMTGGGADILAIDILPYYKYIENGQLEDLTPFMEADESFNISDYRKNILDAAKYNGGQNILPLNYSFDYIAYDKTLVNDEEKALLDASEPFTYEELAEIGKTAFDRLNAADSDSPVKMFSPAGGVGMRGGMFSSLLDQQYNSIVDIPNKTANFTDGRFAGILQTVKEYENNLYISASVENAMRVGGGDMGKMEDQLKQMSAKNYLFKTLDQGSMLQSFNTDKSNNRRFVVRGATGGAMATEDDSVAGVLKYEDTGVIFDFTQAFGINANSDNKSTAWAFIKYLASEEMQLSFNLNGLPIHNGAAMEKAKQQITGELYAPEGNDGTAELTETQTEIFDNYTNTLNKLCDQLDTYVIHDTVIDEMITSEAAYFFDGTKTADEVAKNLQSKVELYLNE